MKKPIDAADRLVSRAGEDSFGVTLADGHEIHVHEETYSETHVVLPPRSKFTEAEREEARTGADIARVPPKDNVRPRATAASPHKQAGASAERSAANCGSAYKEREGKASAAVSSSWNPPSTNRGLGTASGSTSPTRRFHGISKDRLSCRLSASSPWKAAMKRGPRPCAPPPRRILSTPSSIPDCGVTIAICPRILTAPRSVRLSSGLIPGSCWEGTFREYWRIATGKAVS